ncbi:TetR/AcrR family transcriptional regulator [Streptomyces sp. NPDC032472]|uniref:TetR/AcrR family transcriptional regulator n=1 Tax=Streptomyces sp. NPDC032472 TaxID=3155018 RepID=UPI0033D72C6F
MLTRKHLIAVAGVEFDRNGYEGTSFTRLSRSAGVSVGALTFHFSSKAELAFAVEESGRAATRAVVERVMVGGGPALDTLAALVVALGSLIETDPAVRATARLTQERAGAGAGPEWYGCWLPAAGVLLDRARSEGRLRPDADPRPAVLLLAHLVGGTVARVRHGRIRRPGAAVGELRELWRVICRGIASPAEGCGPCRDAPTGNENA